MDIKTATGSARRTIERQFHSEGVPEIDCIFKRPGITSLQSKTSLIPGNFPSLLTQTCLIRSSLGLLSKPKRANKATVSEEKES
jgi:hypothetical protein